jgi:hypothetical protein
MDIEKLDINAVCFGILCNFTPVCGEERAKEAVELVRTLQAENEKLRAELKSKADLVFQQAKELDRRHLLLQEQEAELEQVKRCIEIVENQRDSAIKELENYMVQDVLDGNEPCAICAKASDTPCEYCNPKWRGQKEE